MSQHQAPGPQEDWGATPWNQPTAPPPAVARPGKLQTYMVPAVLVTLFCFLPTGIAAIVYASQVTAKLNAGDVRGAEKASANARTWVIVSAVAGVVLVGIFLLLTLASDPYASDPYGY
jgi:hypothetical protein